MSKIIYNGQTIADTDSTVTMKTQGKRMLSDVVVSGGGGGQLPPYGPNNVNNVLMVKPKRTTIVRGQTIVIKSGGGNLESGFDDSGFDKETYAYCASVTIGNTAMTNIVFEWDSINHKFSASFDDINLRLRLGADGIVSLLQISGSGMPNTTVTISPLEVDGDGTEVELRWVEW